MKTKVIVVMCVILAPYGCGRKKTVQNTMFSGKDYALQFPDTWEVNNKRIMGTDLIGLSPLEDPKDTFRENVGVGLENLPKSMTDKEYVEASLNNMSKAFGLPPGAEFAKARVGNTDGYHLRYSLQMGPKEVDNDVYIVIHKGSAYILTCSNAKGKRDAFKATMDSIIATFKFK